MPGSSIANINNSFGAAFVGLLVSATSVIPWARPLRYSSELLNLQALGLDNCADVSSINMFVILALTGKLLFL